MLDAEFAKMKALAGHRSPGEAVVRPALQALYTIPTSSGLASLHGPSQATTPPNEGGAARGA
jgi:hypothetical protein